MKVSFPAMEGTMGQRTYYSCLMKLSAIPKMFTFKDWIEFTADDREQRVLNKKRVLKRPRLGDCASLSRFHGMPNNPPPALFR